MIRRRTSASLAKLTAELDEVEKAARLATTATVFIVGICFFVMPLVCAAAVFLFPAPQYSSLPVVRDDCSHDAVTSALERDPWSEFKDL